MRIAEQVEDFLKFLGADPGEWIRIVQKTPEGYWNGCNTQLDHLKDVLVHPYTLEGSLYIHGNRLMEGIELRCEPHRWFADKVASAKDDHIVERRMLFIDVDAIRPKGLSEASATEEEKAHAVALRDQIYELFHEFISVRQMAKADSGNGAQIIIPVNLPPEDERLKEILKLLQMYNTEHAEIDDSVWDARRLVPLWGSVKRKGAHDEESGRIWRRAEIDIPHKSRPVAAETIDLLIEHLKAMQPAEPKKKRGLPTREFPVYEKKSDDQFWQLAGDIPIRDVISAAGDNPDSPTCPGCGASGDSSVKIVGDAVLDCKHKTCGATKWNGISYVKQKFDLDAAGAADWYRENFEDLPRKQVKRKQPVAAEDAIELDDEIWLEGDGSERTIVRVGAYSDMARHYMKDMGDVIRRWQQGWYVWNGAHYVERSKEGFAGEVRKWLRGNIACVDKQSNVFPLEPTTKVVNEVLAAVMSMDTIYEGDVDAWIGSGPRVIPFADGLMELESRKMLPSSSKYFSMWAIPSGGADTTVEWEKFLNSVWGDDPDSIDVLQEVMGYLVSGDTRLQKIPVIVGPTRSGKGTIGNVVLAMMGKGATGLGLTTLSERFGLEKLIGKSVAVMGEADSISRDRAGLVTERLKSISGGDMVSIDRKGVSVVSIAMKTRFLILSNMMPALPDPSGALASRYVVLRMTESFLDREDPELLGRLLGELPGIIRWSLEGYDRLTARGHFEMAESGRDEANELKRESSHILDFVAERAVVGPEHSSEVNDVYAEWREYCTEMGREHPGTKNTFGAQLRAAVPKLKRKRLRGADGKRAYYYEGIRLKAPSELDPDPWDEDRAFIASVVEPAKETDARFMKGVNRKIEARGEPRIMSPITRSKVETAWAKKREAEDAKYKERLAKRRSMKGFEGLDASEEDDL